MVFSDGWMGNLNVKKWTNAMLLNVMLSHLSEMKSFIKLKWPLNHVDQYFVAIAHARLA